MRSTQRGRLVTWKADKAYGFIRPDEGGKDVFVHLRDFGRIGREPRAGDMVDFQKMTDRSGRPRAADVSIPGVQRQVAVARQSRRLTPRKLHLFIALVYVTAASYLVARHGLPWFVPGVVLVLSLVAFLMYAFDKSAAMNRRWRTKESTLLTVGLLGGWPGALIAQGMFHHKSSKDSFQAAFWSTVVANCAAIGWWCFRSA